MRLQLVLLYAADTPPLIRKQIEAALGKIMKAHGGEIEIGEFQGQRVVSYAEPTR